MILGFREIYALINSFFVKIIFHDISNAGHLEKLDFLSCVASRINAPLNTLFLEDNISIFLKRGIKCLTNQYPIIIAEQEVGRLNISMHYFLVMDWKRE